MLWSQGMPMLYASILWGCLLMGISCIFAGCKPPYRPDCVGEESPGNIGHRTVRKYGLLTGNSKLTDSATENM
jgi:hypothetical protein